MNSKTIARTATGLLVAGALASHAQAQSSDAIIDKLVDKGILTVDEANELKDEADKNFTAAYSVKSGMPDWVTALKINGDFRGRFEGFYADNPAFGDRARWRYRLRLGITANLRDNLEVGMRLASGDGDPISTNQTLQDNGSKKPVGIDLAYLKWSALNSPSLAGALSVGKIENPFVFSDLVFDGDYTPEGAGQQLSYTLTDKQSLKLNAGQFVLDELGSSGRDPYLWGGQVRLESIWTPKIASSLGASILAITSEDSLTSASVPDINRGTLRKTSVASDGKTVSLTSPVNGYSTLVADAGVTYNLDSAPFNTGVFPIRVFGDYLHNFRADEASDGYQVGVQFGKAGKRKTWEVSYRWKVLEGDAWWEELTDSDFGAYYQNGLTAPPPPAARSANSGYFAGTNVRGHVVKAGYSPFDSLQFNVTWFRTELIEEQKLDSDSMMNRLQVDAVLKF
jgi:hypothetical protein